MKKLINLGVGVLFLALSTLHAQSKLIEQDFWKSQPSLASVKAEVNKGFDFSKTVSMQDPIVYAIRNEAAPEVLTYLLSQPGVDVKKLIVEGRIYLHLAANAGQVAAVDALLNKGSDMYFLDGNGHTAFTFAGFQGHLTPEMIDVFIKHGIDLKRKYPAKDDANILLIAIPYDKDLTITSYLVAKGLSWNSVDKYGHTAFDHAAKVGDIKQFEKLIQLGVKPSDDALLIAAQGTYRSANTLEIFQYLVENLKLNAKATDKEGKNALHYIAKKRDQQEVVNYFIGKGVDVNKQDLSGTSPFFIAAGGKNFDVVQAMWSSFQKKNINISNAKGETILMNAVASGTAETVALLLENGAKAKVTDARGNTLVYTLLASFPVERKGGRGFRGTIIEKERANFYAKMDLLQKAGVDFTKVQGNGETAYHLAATKNNLELLKHLAAYKIPINQKDNEGATALHIAALNTDDVAVLHYFVDKGADVTQQTDFGETAYDLAKENETLKKKHVNLDFLKP
ncbi:Ankyrin repeat [Pustulibacterium marinum]|uniref:Ankyrin repeat n=1 Tax=Pustulibacterium marinum TaxID=1224947 RepID=A0A1I7IMJ0_9FLAO|nr:ankyrin repeat domain-containing protein [Pustulibacterium marinum]SFU74116.1 Ankyrin repeat [Pustulibacterium marinum]